MSSPQCTTTRGAQARCRGAPDGPTAVSPWPTGPATSQPRTRRRLPHALQLLLPTPRAGRAPRGDSALHLLPHPHTHRRRPHAPPALRLAPPTLSSHQALSGPNLLHLVSRAPGSPTRPKHNLGRRATSACCCHHRRPRNAPCRTATRVSRRLPRPQHLTGCVLGTQHGPVHSVAEGPPTCHPQASPFPLWASMSSSEPQRSPRMLTLPSCSTGFQAQPHEATTSSETSVAPDRTDRAATGVRRLT